HAALKISTQSLNEHGQKARFEADPGDSTQQGHPWRQQPGETLTRIRSNIARCSRLLEEALDEYFQADTWLISLPWRKQEDAEPSILHLCEQGEFGSSERKYVMVYGRVFGRPTFTDGSTEKAPEFPRMTLKQAEAALPNWRPAWIGEYKEQYPD